MIWKLLLYLIINTQDHQENQQEIQKNLNKAIQLSGLGLEDDIKNAHNKNVKNTKAGAAIRGAPRSGLHMGYDAGTKLLEINKYTKPIATIGRNSKQGNINE